MQQRFHSLGSALGVLLVLLVGPHRIGAFHSSPSSHHRVRLPRHSELHADSVRDYAAETSSNLVVGIPVPSVHKQGRLLLGQQQQRKRTLPAEESTKATADGSASVPSLVINLVKSIVGGGALALPAAVSSLGDTCEQALPAATLLIVLAGGLYAYYFSLLGQVCRWTGATSYSQAWERTVGAASTSSSAAEGPFNSQTLVSVTVGLKTLLACIAYSMILADSFQSLLWMAGWEQVTRTDALLAVTLTALLPLSLQTNLSKLAPFSAAGLLSFAVTVVTMTARLFDGSYSSSSTMVTTDSTDMADMSDMAVTTATTATTSASNYLLDLPANLQPAFGVHHLDAGSSMLSSLLPDPSGIVLLCTCATAFVAHYNVPRFFHELQSDQKHRFDEAVQTSFGAATATYLIVALAGFATFGTAAQSFILNNYSPHDPWAAACRAAMAACILFTFPLPFVGLRDTVLDVLQQSRPPQQQETRGIEITDSNSNDDWITQHGVSMGLLTLITGVAASVDNLGLIMSVGGGTFSTAVAAVFPTLMFRAAVRQRRESKQVPLSMEEEQKEREEAKLALILMGMSTTIGLTGVGIALNQAFH